MTNAQKSFEVLPAILTVLGIIVLCTLGVWQLDRLEWKQGLLAELDQAYTETASQTPITEDDLNVELKFIRGQISGTALFENAILRAPTTLSGNVGKDLIVPLRLKDGSHIMVNFGWVPVEWGIALGPAQVLKIDGLLKPFPRKNAFTPDNDPDNGQWHHLNAQDIGQAFALENVKPFVMISETGLPGQKNFPIQRSDKPTLKNDHLYYAGFWFTMAFTLLVIYILRFHFHGSGKKD